MPADGKLHDSADVPEPVTLPGVRVQTLVSLLTRLTTPLNPLSAVTVIVEDAAVLALVVTEVGLAVTVKSWTVKVTVAEWDSDPLVPVTVTWTVPADEKVQDNADVPEPVTLLGVRVHTVVSLLARLTVPPNPFRAVTVIVELPGAPARTVTAVGLAVTV